MPSTQPHPTNPSLCPTDPNRPRNMEFPQERERLSKQASSSDPKPSPLHFADSQGSPHSRFPGFSAFSSSQTRPPSPLCAFLPAITETSRVTLSSREGRGLPKLVRLTHPPLGRVLRQWMSYGVTPPDQAAETRPYPVVGSNFGRLPNQGEKGRSRPTCLLRLQSLSSPLEAPNRAAPSLGALGAGERRGGRASGGAPPGGIRITACLLDGCLGNGLSLLAPWSATPSPRGSSCRPPSFASLPSHIVVVSGPLLCSQSPLPPNPQLHCASSFFVPPTLIRTQTDASVPGMCTARVSWDLCLHPSRRIRKILLLVSWDQRLCHAAFPEQGVQRNIFFPLRR